MRFRHNVSPPFGRATGILRPRIAARVVRENRDRRYPREEDGNVAEGNAVWDNRIRNTVSGSRRSFIPFALTAGSRQRSSPLCVPPRLSPTFRDFLLRALVPPSSLLSLPSLHSRSNEGITSNYKKLSADQIRDGGVLITTQKSGLAQLE